MSIQPVAQTSAANTTSPTTSTTAAAATVNYNEFLTLLVSEMKNQDPTNPMDPTQTVAQLATFSGVEQQVQTNTKLDSLLAGFGFSTSKTSTTG